MYCLLIFIRLSAFPVVVKITRMFTFLVDDPELKLQLPRCEGGQPKLYNKSSTGGISIDMLVYKRILLKSIRWLMMVG